MVEEKRQEREYTLPDIALKKAKIPGSGVFMIINPEVLPEREKVLQRF